MKKKVNPLGTPPSQIGVCRVAWRVDGGSRIVKLLKSFNKG